MLSLICEIKKTKETNELIYTLNENRPMYIKNKLVLTKRARGERVN